LIESRRFEHWTEACHVLLHAPVGTQREIEKMVGKLTTMVRAGKLEPQFVLASLGPERESYGLAIFLYKDLTRSDRDSLALGALEEAIGRSSREALVLGIDVDQSEEAYSFVAFGSGEHTPTK
jgi:hypothetical protein